MSFYCYLKVTNFCNLQCEHCYASSHPAENEWMSPDLFLAFAEKVFKLASFGRQDSVLFIFHGGEPLGRGSRYLRKFVENSVVAKKVEEGKCKFQIQSNLTLNVNDDLVSFLKDYCNASIGTSYDPYIRKLNGSFDRFVSLWKKNVESLLEKDIYISVNITLTKILVDNFDLFVDTLEFLKGIGINSFRLERFVPTGRGSINAHKFLVDDKQFFSFMRKVLDYYVSTAFNDRNCSVPIYYINPLDDMLLQAKYGRGASCWAGRCMFDTVTLNYDGKIYTCPEMLGKGENFIGSVYDEELSVLGSIKRSEFVTRQFLLANLNCQYYTYCYRGCPSYPHKCSEAYPYCQEFFRRLIELSSSYGDYFDHLASTSSIAE